MKAGFEFLRAALHEITPLGREIELMMASRIFPFYSLAGIVLVIIWWLL